MTNCEDWVKWGKNLYTMKLSWRMAPVGDQCSLYRWGSLNALNLVNQVYSHWIINQIIKMHHIHHELIEK